LATAGVTHDQAQAYQFLKMEFTNSLRVPLQANYTCLRLLICIVVAFSPNLYAHPDSSGDKEARPITANAFTIVSELDRLSVELENLVAERRALAASLENVPETELTEEREQLAQINRTIATLRATFEITALEGLDGEQLDDTDEEYNWRAELIEIVSPVLESLKTVTEKPRRKAELRAENEVLEQRLGVALEARQMLQDRQAISGSENTNKRLDQLADKWDSQISEYEQQRALVTQQLGSIDKNETSLLTSFTRGVQNFFLGRGLTIFLAVLGALVAWGCARFIWWFANRYVISKPVRRRSFWYRLFSYSYFLVTFLFIMVAVFVILYLRDDILLIALMFLLLAAAALSLRRLIPQYMQEARLLLNLGAVREEEEVTYNGLPWIVRSLNLYTILHNPELTGIIRLPMDKIKELVSRPIKDTIWFPTSRDDYIFLPDGTFGQILKQTPDLVEVLVRGGMVTTYPAKDFYAMHVTNLSREETFGVNVTFGFDYAQQAICLDTIPEGIKTAVENALIEAGYEEGIRDIMVDLKEANASSLDFIIFLTVENSLASKYFALQRLVQKTCVELSNNESWSIPFPQLTIHQALT